MRKRKAMVKNTFPPGWNDKRVRAVIDYYESQSEDEELEEITRILDDVDFRLMRIPVTLVPDVEKLLQRSSATRKVRTRSSGSRRGETAA